MTCICKYTRTLFIVHFPILILSSFSPSPSPTLLLLAHLLHALLYSLLRKPPGPLDPSAVIRGPPRARHDVHFVERMSQGASFYGVAHEAVQHPHACRKRIKKTDVGMIIFLRKRELFASKESGILRHVGF